jgi:hypothetical protein
MAANPDVVRYIRDQASAGFGKEEIYRALLDAGWTKEEVNEAIYEMMGKSPGKPAPTEQKVQPGEKASSKSHSRRNVLIIIGVIIALLAVLFVFFNDSMFSALRALGLAI